MELLTFGVGAALAVVAFGEYTNKPHPSFPEILPFSETSTSKKKKKEYTIKTLRMSLLHISFFAVFEMTVDFILTAHFDLRANFCSGCTWLAARFPQNFYLR